MKFVGCPNCQVQYPVNRLYRDPHDRPAPGKTYTILCTVCDRRFDVTFRKRWLFSLGATVRGEP